MVEGARANGQGGVVVALVGGRVVALWFVADRGVLFDGFARGERRVVLVALVAERQVEGRMHDGVDRLVLEPRVARRLVELDVGAACSRRGRRRVTERRVRVVRLVYVVRVRVVQRRVELRFVHRVDAPVHFFVLADVRRQRRRRSLSLSQKFFL